MGKKITSIVTGGAGFIGSHLCDELLERDHHVICIDNLITGSRKNITHLINNPSFEFIKQDLVKPLGLELEKKILSSSYVYHLASPASPPQYRKYSLETLLVNSQGTNKLLKLIKKSKISFLFTSTSEVYGDPLEHPQNEKYFGNVNPIGIRACYDEAKRFAEALIMEYKRKYSTNVRIVRIFNTYGPRMQKDDGRVISNFVNQALDGKPLTVYGDGSQTRSFCFVSDMVDGIVSAMETPKAIHEIINLGFPKEHSIIEIAQIILNLTGSSSKIEYFDMPQDDPVRRKPDIQKAKKLLKWKPKTCLIEGLKLTIDYFSKT